jgi:hypothetical protein
MNEILEEKLKQLANDRQMVEAIKVLSNKIIEENRPIAEKTDDNKILGEKYRAYEVSRDMVEKIIKDIEWHKENNQSLNKFNKEK